VADDFPVVVAMRMSLAIPFYFSAIPLYTIKPTAFEKVARTRLAEDDLQINLFSDGGITSNFPIHSFDRWLPTRPTFGITLAPMPAESLERVERDALYEAFISVVTVD
jgi:predicted acylesterase/phospholipase RssA